jgi:hypothetical protein
MKPVEDMTIDWKQYAYTPEEASLRPPELIARSPPKTKAISAKDANVKVIRL